MSLRCHTPRSAYANRGIDKASDIFESTAAFEKQALQFSSRRRPSRLLERFDHRYDSVASLRIFTVIK